MNFAWQSLLREESRASKTETPQLSRLRPITTLPVTGQSCGLTRLHRPENVSSTK